jgi:hypothetical protein
MAEAGEEQQAAAAVATAKSEDKRFAFLIKQVTILLKSKPEAAAKIKEDEKSAKVCSAFFDDPDEKAIFVFSPAKDTYTASPTPPPNFKQKCLYILKKEDTVTSDNVESCVCTAEFSTTPLEQILCVAQVRNYRAFSNFTSTV